MDYQVPCAEVTVGDPRSLGALTKLGWAGDFVFAPPGAPYQPWRHRDTEYVPELKAVAPAGRVVRRDMSLADWQVQAGAWDDRARPATSPRTTFLHAYSGAVAAVSRVVSTASFGPNWCGWFYRYVPPAGTLTANPCDFSIKLCAESGPQWRLVIPTRNIEAKYPRLLRAEAAGLAAVEVSRCDVDTTASEDSGWQEYVIWCEQTLNSWIIVVQTSSAATRWFHTPPGTDVADTTAVLCSAGPLEVQSQGQQLMFAIAPIRYPPLSECYLRSYYTVSSDLADLASPAQTPTSQAVIVAPAHSDAWVEVETNAANALAPRVTFVNHEDTRAVCGVVSVIVPPQFATGSYGEPWSSAGGNATFREGDTIEYVRRSCWRGNEFSLLLRDPSGGPGWRGNEVCGLKAGYQTTAEGPVLTPLVTGYLVGPERDRRGPVEAEVSLRVADYFGARMAHKSMLLMPSFARMTFGEAFEIIASRLGFAAAQRELDEALAAVVLPGPQVPGEQSLYWGGETSPEEALDVLARCVGASIGIDASGRLFARPRATYSSPAYTLDSDATAAGDVVRHIRYQRDLEHFANNCFVITGSEGWRQMGWARDSASESTATAADFIGDQFISVESVGQAFASASALAAASLQVRARFAEVIQWQPARAHADLAPGQFVKVQVEGMQIAADSIYYVTEERGKIVPTWRDAGGWQQQFAMVRVQ